MDDIRIRLARDRGDFESCVRLQREVWSLADVEITSTIQLIATTWAGGLVHLAETAAGEAVGFAYAFPALRGGVAHLHSDMLAVRPEHQKRGVGLKLKWAQRADALQARVTVITWTYDPLQALNANLNLRRLGAIGTEFVENFYGVTTSELHHGLPTDRLVARWDLDAPRVQQLAQGARLPRSVPAPLLPRINDVKWQAGWPVSSDPRLDLEAPELLLEIPPEWNVLCQAAPLVAAGWQEKVRRAFQTYLRCGYVAADFAPTEEAGRRRPLYVLKKG